MLLTPAYHVFYETLLERSADLVGRASFFDGRSHDLESRGRASALSIDILPMPDPQH